MSDQFIGKYVLCRCHSAGVHCGELVSIGVSQRQISRIIRGENWKHL